MKIVPLLLSATILSVTIPAALPQDYPSKPIRLIVPFAPGGGTDILARVIAQRVSESLGQPLVVDNRAGGGGTIAAEMAVRANPDGHTLIIVSGSYSANAALYTLPYHPVNDIQPIILIGESGLVIASNPSVPVNSVKALMAHAKANPGKLNYGSPGTGTVAHLAAELFKLEAEVDLTHVPYKGASPALNDLIGGQIHLLFATMPSTIAHVKAGRLRVIGVTTAKRSSALPEVPTVGETVAGYEVVNWYGIWGPKGLSKSIVTRWNKEVAKVLQADEMKRRMAGEGLETAGGPPEQFLSSIRRDVDKWKKVVKGAKITVGS
jgi:tripartite-type tricarboxylate transporter receptor subunit TctC